MNGFAERLKTLKHEMEQLPLPGFQTPWKKAESGWERSIENHPKLGIRLHSRKRPSRSK